MLKVLAILALFAPVTVAATEKTVMIDTIITDHILRGFNELTIQSEQLKQAASTDCSATSPDLRAAWHSAFDAWIKVSHLRFGPSETNDRAFALAFWPDTKGFTPRILRMLIASQDEIVGSVDGFAEVSIAARGFYALEFLLYDPGISSFGDAQYRCRLVQVIAADIDANADAILADWAQTYAAELRTAKGVYRTQDEALQELFKALNAGLQFTSDTRLGRPMGSLERPRPKRAEARRSGRSLHNVALSLVGLRDLAMLLSAQAPDLAARFTAAFDKSVKKADQLDDPVFAGVSTTGGRFRVEALQQSINDIRALVANDLGPTLGVAVGFNSLDGD